MRTVKLPFYLLIGFNLLTLLIFISGPFTSDSGNHLLAIGYILVNLLFIWWGIKSGLRRGYKTTAIIRRYPLSDVSNRILSIYMVFFVATFLIKYAYELNVPVFDISGLVDRIIAGIFDPLLGYTRDRSYASYSWSLYVLISVFDGVFFIVGMLCWRKLSRFQKYLFVFLAIIESLKSMSTGSSFGEIKMMTTLAMVYLAGMKNETIEKRRVGRILLYVLTIVFVTLLIFGHNMEGRAGGEFSDMTVEHFNFNTDSFINKYVISLFPMRIQNLYVYICHYLNNGYYNLEYAFNCKFEWTYFLGSNNAKSHIFALLGFDVEPLNYQIKIFKEYGVDPYIYWHSCYTWIANDVSFFGVPIVMYFVGKFCASALVMYRKHQDLLSGMVFVIFANMIIFLFANNNYIANLFYSFILVFPYWLFTRYFKER